MSSFRRKRPLAREARTFADDVLLIVACEDRYATEQYFRMLPNQRVKIRTLPSIDDRSNPEAVLERLVQFQREHELQADDQLWLALDTDHWATGSHKKALAKVLNDCREQNIQVAMSHPCFDLWLLLHHTEVGPDERLTCAEVADRFRAVVGQFNKTRLRPEHYPPEKIRTAVARARALDVDPDQWFPDRPGSRIYRIVEQAVAKDFVRLDLGG